MSKTETVPAEPPWEDFAHEVRTARNHLRSATETLNDLTEKAAGGDRKAVKDLPAAAAEAGIALRKAYDIEEKFNDWLAKRSGALRAGEHDFDAALADVKGRLADLEGALGAGPDAEGPEA